jgi:CMP-N-acetylneuraminic acid synthetase
MLRRKLWEENQFDETLANIEDRVWAEKILQRGHKIVYEPTASVYHYHGIHQNGNVERCANVVRILDSIKPKTRNNIHVDIEKLNIIAVIPVKDKGGCLNGKPLVGHTIEHALQSKYIDKVIVSTDSPELAKLCEEFGASVPFLRDESLSEDFVDIEKVLQYSQEKIEDLKIFSDLIVYLEITFPFRPKQLIDDMIIQLIEDGFDSVLAARRESKSIWSEEDGRIERVDKGDIPRKYKEPSFVGIKGLCCVTHPEFLREGSLLGERIGIYEINNPYSSIEVRGKEDLEMAEKLIEGWEGEKSR